MDAIAKGKPARRGFTLVEMLAVVMIIGILASLITAAAFAAIRRAKVTAIAVEISKLHAALEYLGSELGNIGPPPDFTDATAVKRYFARAFPDYTGDPPTGLDPSTALVYWLQGPGGKGFSANSSNPFDNSSSRIGPFFEFNPGRLKDSRYYPPGVPMGSSASGFAPYVYFSAKRGGGYDGHPGWETTGPCRDTRSEGWANARSFQIRSSGLDGKFGCGTSFPPVPADDKATFDDISNFSGKGTFEDSL